MKQRILIVDDDTDFATVVATRCRQIGLVAETAANHFTALTIIQERRPDLICLDIQLPSGSGLTVREYLISDPLTAQIPTVFLSGSITPDTVHRCRELRAPLVPKSTSFWDVLQPLLNEMMQNELGSPTSLPTCDLPDGVADRQKPVIVIADDDRDLLDLLSRRCRNLGARVYTATDSMAALRKIDQHLPQVAILDVQMPSGSGLSITEMMATNERLAHITVVMLTGKQDPETIRRCHSLRAFYVAKCPNVWSRIEPLLLEVLPKEPAIA